jgi:glutamate formiminotransferase
VDVVPFVPVKNMTVEETVELARQFAKTVVAKLALPVYFYGEINHKELPSVRKGGFEPDLGKGRHVTAGIAAVGVRDFLIAFNVNLDTNDADIAKSIAKNIREKRGGLPGIRALGIELKSRNITQVSINITNHRMTSMKKVFDQVKKWAKEYKVKILESELVGMIPREACFEGMEQYLSLKNFSKNLVLAGGF